MKPISENSTPGNIKAYQHLINLYESLKPGKCSSPLEARYKVIELVDSYEDMIKSFENESEIISLNKNWLKEKHVSNQNQLVQIISFIGQFTKDLIMSNNEKVLSGELIQLCLKYSNLILNIAEKSVVFFLFFCKILFNF
jgi:hypothetical protein